jgi:hypothetical protein
VHDPTRLSCRYAGALVGGGAAAVTLQTVSAVFGPTFPGEACSASNVFAIHYPGLLFVFPAAAPGAPQATAAARIVLCAPAAHAGGTHARLDAVLAAAPPVQPHGAAAPRAGPLVAAIGVGLRLPSGATLPFGASPQDLVAELGAPGASMVKGTDAMLIHAPPGAHADGRGASGDYFLSWFGRGLDVLVDGDVRRRAVCCKQLTKRLARACC